MNAEDKVFKNIDIKFSINGFMFHAVNISSTTMVRNIPLHSHGVGCYEVHYISHGHGFLKVNGAEYELTPNTLYITGPLVPHSQFTDKNDPMHEYGIYLKTDETARSDSNDIISAFLSQDFWIGQDRQELMILFGKLFSELENRSEGYTEMLRLLFSEAVVSIARNYIKSSPYKSEFSSNTFERTSLTMEEYFLYEYRTACLEELSQRLGLSTRQTQRLIRKYYGSSFSQKKTQARMSAAQLLLADDTLSLAEISERLGYSSQEYFTSAFKSYYKISPGKYRKTAKL